MRLARQLGVVSLTYLTRPAFGVTVLVGLVSLGLTFTIRNEEYVMRMNTLLFLGTTLLFLLPFVMLVAFIVIFLLHVREQLRGGPGALTPDFRGPHLIVAGVIFAATVLGLTLMFHAEFHLQSFIGVLVVVMTFLTLAALSAVGSVWWLFVLVPLSAAALSSHTFQSWMSFVTFPYLPEGLDTRWPPELRARVLVESQLGLAIRIGLLAANFVALTVLAWRAKPASAVSGSSTWADRFPWSQSGGKRIASIVSPAAEHRPVLTVIARGRHRRLAVHSPAAPWFFAGVLAVVLVFIMFLTGHDRWNNEALRALVLVTTILPAVVVAGGWRERMPHLGYESLYPAGRKDFATELAVAMAIDFAEFWLAGWLAALVPIAIWNPRLLVSSQFAVSVVASAMMQFLIFGGMFLAVRLRAWLLQIGVLILLMLASLIPIMETWSDRPSLSQAHLLLVGLLEMAAGAALALAGRAAWRRGDLV